MSTCHLSSHNSNYHYLDSRNINPWTDLRLGKARFAHARNDLIFVVDIRTSMGLKPSSSDCQSYGTQTHLEYLSLYKTGTHLGAHLSLMSTMVETETQLRYESLVPHPHFLLYISLSNGICKFTRKHLNTWLTSTSPWLLTSITRWYIHQFSCCSSNIRSSYPSIHMFFSQLLSDHLHSFTYIPHVLYNAYWFANKVNTCQRYTLRYLLCPSITTYSFP